MNNRLGIYLKVLVLSIILSSNIYASDVLKKVEKAYLKNDYDKAKKEFNDIPKGYNKYKYTFKKMEKYTRKFLETSNEIKEQINQCKKQKYVCNRIDTYLLKSDYDTYTTYVGYFSKEFQTKINTNYSNLIDSINYTNNAIINKKSNKNIEPPTKIASSSNVLKIFQIEKTRLLTVSQKKYGHKRAYKGAIKLTQGFIDDLVTVQQDIKKFKNDNENIYFETALYNLKSKYDDDYQTYSYQLSDEFKNLIQTEYDRTIKEANNLMLSMKNKSKKQQQLKDKKHNDYLLSLKQQDKAIDKKVKSMGYKGFTELDITSLMFHTQNNGNLGEYLNSVVGCSAQRKQNCNDLNSNLKVSQILDDSVIYRYFEILDGKLLEYSVIVPKEANKIYQMKQRFDNDFYVFVGMFNYTSTIGIKFSIPKLKKIHIK